MGRADKIRSASDKNVSSVAGDLEKLAAQLDRDGSVVTGLNSDRLKTLAGILKERSAKLR